MEKDLQNILRFTNSVSGLSYIANLDGTPKAICSLGIPFDETDLKLVSMGNPSNGYYISAKIPDGLTVISAIVKYADNSEETLSVAYDAVQFTITNFNRNDTQSILIKTA